MNITQSIMFIMPLAKWHLEGGDGYENLVWEDLFYPKPSKERLQDAYDLSQKAIETQYDYRLLRREHYPTAEEQLAMIFDLGIDGWKSHIQNVKDNIPKSK